MLIMTAISVLILCGCEPYQPSNAPRGTVTMKDNILTTVTTVDTTRADTYSEYMSSLKEAGEDNGYYNQRTGDHVRMTADTGMYEAIEPDTGVRKPETESIQRETAISRVEVIIVTTAPPITSEEETTSTVVCETEEPSAEYETQTAVPDNFMPEFPDFDIGDIPAVPSEAVRADTALTIP
ncbi:MAG: hypothetical protein IJZ72_08335 [Oscillospiraceae bacterium]|nr:hypothetical protein [Oscillospiraceae bacterium]